MLELTRRPRHRDYGANDFYIEPNGVELKVDTLDTLGVHDRDVSPTERGGNSELCGAFR